MPMVYCGPKMGYGQQDALRSSGITKMTKSILRWKRDLGLSVSILDYEHYVQNILQELYLGENILSSVHKTNHGIVIF
ncbi:hypothetical protein RIR_jg26892.t1 [Rhizophagus irregularis DAOM 181602=DAOM 197198]|nr:hypothetical protein RIR_jg26892.t1 [Rhizophagus irregularis DAOM 181602=DAOM 197198]